MNSLRCYAAEVVFPHSKSIPKTSSFELVVKALEDIHDIELVTFSVFMRFHYQISTHTLEQHTPFTAYIPAESGTTGEPLTLSRSPLSPYPTISSASVSYFWKKFVS